MFTGIIEALGVVRQVRKEGKNNNLLFESPISSDLKVDQSVSHNGVCLTVTKTEAGCHWVTAVDETLKKSSLGILKVGEKVNLERCMKADGRFDGHIVQGHVDQTGKCTAIYEADGSWLFEFDYDGSSGNVTVEKGSIAVNGVSLTCFNSVVNKFTVTIIPYTFKHTQFQFLKQGSIVNLEFDIVGKYIRKMLSGSINPA
jgi:riboflavin synthase